MESLYCGVLLFSVNLAQFLINIVFFLPNMFGATTPDITGGVGSLFGCNL